MSGSGAEVAERLQAIRQRADAATPGPWERVTKENPWSGIRGPSNNVCGMWDGGRGSIETRDADVSAEADAEFIAAARVDIPWLLERLEAADQKLAETAEFQSRMATAADAAEARVTVLEQERNDARDALRAIAAPDVWPHFETATTLRAIARRALAVDGTPDSQTDSGDDAERRPCGGGA